MRAGFSQNLLHRLRRADPMARPILEALVVTTEDVRRRKDEWDAADSLTGLTSLADGGVRLAGSLSALVANTTSTGYLTDLEDDLSTFAAIRITWAGTQDPDTVIQRLKLYLHPQQNGGNPKTVDHWVVRCWAVIATDVFAATGNTMLELAPLGDALNVDATGTSAALFTFDFSGVVTQPKPMAVLSRNYANDTGYETPVTIVTVGARTADGSTADNVGLGYDSGSAVTTTSGVSIATRTLVRLQGYGIPDGAYEDQGSAGGSPRMEVDTASFSAATVTFSSGTPLDLGASPSGTVEFVARGEIPPGASITTEVRNDADSAWVAFVDGDTPDDLSGVGANQTYKLRATLTPDSGNNITPIIRELGVREVTTQSLDGLVRLSGPTWKVDPVSLRGEISELTATVLRDGEPDFLDRITLLLSDNHVADLEFRLWVGHPDLDRADWLLVDTFLLDDYDPAGDQITMRLVSVLSELRQVLPVPTQATTTSGVNITFDAETRTITRASGSFVDDGWLVGDQVNVDGSSSNDGAYDVVTVAALVLTVAASDTLVDEGPAGSITLTCTVRRRTIDYPSGSINTIAEVYSDLLDNHVGFRERWQGPDLQDTSDVAKSLIETDAKRELDALAYLAGFGIITSQGRIKTVDLFGYGAAVHIFQPEELQETSTSPGLASRTPEFFVPHTWDEGDRRFLGEVQANNADALTNIGMARIDGVQRLDEEVAKWMPDSTLALTIGARVVETLGTGLRVWRFRTTYSYPELEPGDLVVVPTRHFVARDPITGTAVRGRLWAIGPLVETTGGASGPFASEFAVWIRSFSDIAGSTNLLITDGVPRLDVYWDRSRTTPGTLQVALAARPGSPTIKYVVQDADSTPPPYGDGSYATYSAPFNVNLSAATQQLVAYADLRGQRSPRTIRLLDRGNNADITASIVEATTGVPRVSWIPDDDCKEVRIWARKNTSGYSAGDGWYLPVAAKGGTSALTLSTVTRSGSTVTATAAAAHGLEVGSIVIIAGATETDYNGTYPVTVTTDTAFTYELVGGVTPTSPASGSPTWQETVLNKTYYIGWASVNPDGGAVGADGAGLVGMVNGDGVGGTDWDDTINSYSAGDDIGVVLVPIDYNQNAGTKVSLRGDLSGSAAAALTKFSAMSTHVGSDCVSDFQELTVTWTPNATVSGATHDLYLYRRDDGNPRTLVTTVSDPSSSGTTSYTDTLDGYEDYPVAPWHTFQYEYELVATAGPTVVDSGLGNIVKLRFVICS